MDNLTKPSSNTGSSESNSNHNTNTRSNPVCLEVAVTIRSLPGEQGEASSGPAKPTQEEARTVIVFENGAVLRLAGNFPPGQAVTVSNPQGRDVVCRVVSARNLPTVKGYIEVEFLEPANDFWGIHKAAGQSNASNSSAVVVTQPQAVAQPQIIPSDTPTAPPAPARMGRTMPKTPAPTGNAPSFEDIAGLVRMSSPAISRGKAPQSTPRIPVSKNIDESNHDSVEAARPHSPAVSPGPAADLTSLSGKWEGTPVPARRPPTSNDILGKFSASHETSVSSSSESRGKAPLIIAGAAVILVGLGAGFFYTHQGSSGTPSPVPVAVASQPPKPVLPAPMSIPTPAVAAQAAVEQTPPSSPDVSPASSIPKEILTTSAPSAPQTPRRQANNVVAKQPDRVIAKQPDRVDEKPPDHLDVKQPDRSAQQPQLAHELKMSAPTAESRSGRLVDGSVPNITEVTTTSAVIGTPGGGLIPPVSHTENPSVFPAVVAGSVSSLRTVSEPKLITSTRPVYPPLAKQANVEGDVLISADVDPSGKVVGAKAVSGPMYLREAAVDAVRNWKYEPATLNGKPTTGQITVKIQFRLK